MTPTRTLVTGGAGMIGSNLVRRLVAEGHEVFVVDNLWRGRKEYLLDEQNQPIIDLEKRFFDADLAEPGVLDPLLDGIDYVFHLADVVAGIGYVFDNQLSLFRRNLLINTHVVASVARHPELKGYIYVGTACSFPAELQTGVDARPLVEEDLYPASPESAYGWSKLMGQYEAELMQQEQGIPVALPMLHNVYGAPCDFDEARSQVIPALIRKAIEYPHRPFEVWGSGSQGRAFVHVDDVVDGLIAAMRKGLGKGPIQIGPDYCNTIREIAETIVEISAKPIEIHYDLSRPEGDRGRCANHDKATEVLGWRPRIDLREGLSSLYQWIERRMHPSSIS